jgi:hypothetical protein
LAQAGTATKLAANAVIVILNEVKPLRAVCRLTANL